MTSDNQTPDTPRVATPEEVRAFVAELDDLTRYLVKPDADNWVLDWDTIDSVCRAELPKAVAVIRAMEATLREMRDACVQSRGALRLDVMVDDDGKPFGTTTVALASLDAAIAAADALLGETKGGAAT